MGRHQQSINSFPPSISPSDLAWTSTTLLVPGTHKCLAGLADTGTVKVQSIPYRDVFEHARLLAHAHDAMMVYIYYIIYIYIITTIILSITAIRMVISIPFTS